jgi:hypothetical protein
MSARSVVAVCVFGSTPFDNTLWKTGAQRNE